MNDNEINIAIAEACGWKLKRQFTGQAKGIGVWLDANGDLRSWTCIPNYTTDLNAMHEAEKVLTEKQIRSYAFTLAQVLDTTPTVDLDDQFLNVHATARQRAEAFLRTLGKWKD